jgi:hypothetical protein
MPTAIGRGNDSITVDWLTLKPPTKFLDSGKLFSGNYGIAGKTDTHQLAPETNARPQRSLAAQDNL